LARGRDASTFAMNETSAAIGAFAGGRERVPAGAQAPHSVTMFLAPSTRGLFAGRPRRAPSARDRTVGSPAALISKGTLVAVAHRTLG
jgi:hypothetical protein